MNKAIMISQSPHDIVKILNGYAKLLIYNKLPKNYEGWIYIYCNKGPKDYCLCGGPNWPEQWFYTYSPMHNGINSDYQGKVLARFWCNKVGGVAYTQDCNFHDTLISDVSDDIYTESCLSYTAIDNYFKRKDGRHIPGYAVRITKLEIFDKPMELKDFKVYDKSYDNVGMFG